MVLKVYGFMFSQPTRAVVWLLKVKQTPFEFVWTRPPRNVTPEFEKLNPNRFVPVIQDGDLTLFESNAILTHLADKFQWTDVYPTDLQARAKVNQYLHWHHTNTRLATTQVLRPYMWQALGKATATQLKEIESKEQTIAKFVQILEIWLTKAPYIADTIQPTVADYACYCEMDQLELMQVFDFTKYPKTWAWMQRMKEIPHHDEVRQDLHQYLNKFKLKPIPNDHPDVNSAKL